MNRVLHILIIVLGMVLVIGSSDGTWDSANWVTYTGMFIAVGGIMYIPVRWLISKIWK